MPYPRTQQANLPTYLHTKGVGRNIFRRGGATEKQGRKLAPLRLPLLYQYHNENSGGHASSADAHAPRYFFSMLNVKLGT